MNRLLSKFHLVAKIVLFGIFASKFFDHVFTHALKILMQICTKTPNFFNQSKFRKKSNKYFCFLLLIINTCVLSAEYQSSVEVRTAAFFHTSHRMREIYGNVGASYQVEASTRIYDCMEGWANFDWFSKKGRSDGFSDPTRINISNFSLGVKFPYQFCDKFTAYLGIGPSFSWVNLKNKSFCTHQTVSKWAVGGVLKTGINYFLCERIFIDLFVDYLYQPVNFKTHVNVGGFKTGVGIGVKF